jgi:hypothetical protein
MVSLLDVELLNESARIALDDGIFNTKGFLKAIASQADFTEKMALAFGDSFDTAKAEDLRQEWLTGDLTRFRGLKFVRQQRLTGLMGRFLLILTRFISRGSTLPRMLLILRQLPMFC